MLSMKRGAKRILIMVKMFLRCFLCCFLLSILYIPVCADDYTIGSNDVLTITVFDHEELKTTVRVSNTGSIVFPLIQVVQVGGLKVSAAAERIQSLLADGYIINPQVNIFVDEFKSKKVIVLGQVMQPGVVELRGPTTLLELLSKTGGLKEGAGEVAVIKRTVVGESKTITVDLNALFESGDSSKNITIHGGDTISIAKSGTCYITGEVKQPNAYLCGKNSTVLKLVSLAGGFTGLASTSSVKIIRIVDGEKKIYSGVELNTTVRPDDIVMVPESFF